MHARRVAVSPCRRVAVSPRRRVAVSPCTAGGSRRHWRLGVLGPHCGSTTGVPGGILIRDKPIVIRRSLGVPLRRTVFVILLCLIAGGSAVPAAAVSTQPRLDRVSQWNLLAMAAVRANRASDADAARLYAML